MGARLQTWFPFSIQIWLNGREWLAHQLERRGHTDFRRHGKRFIWLGDPALAQQLMDQQLATAWPDALDAIARALNPLHGEIFTPWPQTYYWSGYQTEWATDVLFTSAQALADIYPALVRHATLHFQSPDVLRFFGRKVHGSFTGDVITSFKRRPEGVRVTRAGAERAGAEDVASPAGSCRDRRRGAPGGPAQRKTGASRRSRPGLRILTTRSTSTSQM